MKKLLKAANYVAAPEFSKGRKIARKAARQAGKWAMQHTVSKRRAPSMASMALKGFGAAVVAVPLGIWLGRRLLGNEGGDR